MNNIIEILEQKFKQAFINCGIDKNIPVILTEASKPEFGDFQINGVMSAAKLLKTNPRDLASSIVANIDISALAEKLEIAGPGFINIWLSNQFLVDHLQQLSPQNKFGALTTGTGTVVVDLSSPNLAKEMHVGHLRSTVIGDSLARIFEYIGYNVIRQNHVGDWGTQFGMLIAYMREKIQLQDQLKSFSIPDLESFYREAKIKFDTDRDFANTAREYVVKLQSGDEEVLNYWSLFTIESQKHCDMVYQKLGINLGSEVLGGYYHSEGKKIPIPSQRGESFYNPQLSLIIDQLEQKKLLSLSDGAKCVFFADGELSGGETTPFIVQKNDGGYLYSTTDLAAMDYRVNQLNVNKIVYVVDARQSFHFKQLFLVGKKANFAHEETELIHSAFGTMMNEDGRPFKTRDGGTVKLIDLIDEAIVRAKIIVGQRNPDWSEQDRDNLAYVIAIGAIKYADLSKNRLSDYIFSFDKMLAFEGNTAPYLLYAYTRIQSILRLARDNNHPIQNIKLHEVTEHKLAVHLVKFSHVVQISAKECYPHYLCHYLYNLAGLFMQFYENCPILKIEDDAIQKSRLALSSRTADILADGLAILGIQTVTKM